MTRAPRTAAGGRVLLAGVAALTTLFASAPAVLAFLATGSTSPTAWSWDTVTSRLAACTSSTGLHGLLECRPAQAMSVAAGLPEEHRKGRRIVVRVPVAEPATSVHPVSARSSTQRKATSGKPAATAPPKAPQTAPAQRSRPSPSPPREDGRPEDRAGD
ncbi:MAG: hypothetical protein M3075_16610 [Candidatus Dormibacteraeota bacterium]|nr:hypothetical protein [Candidatus Dormibacteraeota bacterium]